MEIILITRDELKELIHRTVKQTLKDILPEVIRKASKKEWMNTDEVMEYMKCSRRHIQYLRDSRQLPFSQNGRTIRYHIDDIDQFLTNHRVRRRS